MHRRFIIFSLSALGLLAVLLGFTISVPAAVPTATATISIAADQPGMVVPTELWGSNLLQSAPFSQTVGNSSFINSASNSLGAKGDFFKADGGSYQTYTLRFVPVRDVCVLWAASQADVENRVFTEWQQVPELSTQPPDAKVFTLEAEAGILQFGDGTHGAVPPADSYFLVEYTTFGHDGFLDFVRAMRAAPSSVPIQIGAATLPFVDSQPITTSAEMRAIFTAMDFYVHHQYNASFPYDTYDRRRQMASEQEGNLVSAMLPAYLQSIGITQTLPSAITEWNIFLDTDYWHINRTLEGAVIAAEWFIRLLNAGEAAPIAYANQFALHGGSLALIRSQTNYSLAPMATVFQAFAPWRGSQVVSTTTTTPANVIPQEQEISPPPTQLILPPHAVIFLTLWADSPDPCAQGNCRLYLPLLASDEDSAVPSRFGINRTGNRFKAEGGGEFDE